MSPEEFYEGIQIVELAIQSEIEKTFCDSVLWPVFRADPVELWHATCRKVADSAYTSSTLVLQDFHRGKARASVGTTDQAIQEAVERRDALKSEHDRTDKSWGDRTPDDVLEEQAEAGNDFAKEILERRRKEKE